MNGFRETRVGRLGADGRLREARANANGVPSFRPGLARLRSVYPGSPVPTLKGLHPTRPCRDATPSGLPLSGPFSQGSAPRATPGWMMKRLQRFPGCRVPRVVESGNALQARRGHSDNCHCWVEIGNRRHVTLFGVLFGVWTATDEGLHSN